MLLKNLYFAKGYGAVILINEFPAKGLKKSPLNDFVKRLKQAFRLSCCRSINLARLHTNKFRDTVQP